MSDISSGELEQLYDGIDEEIRKCGFPTEEELSTEIDRLNGSGQSNE